MAQKRTGLNKKYAITILIVIFLSTPFLTSAILSNGTNTAKQDFNEQTPSNNIETNLEESINLTNNMTFYQGSILENDDSMTTSTTNYQNTNSANPNSTNTEVIEDYLIDDIEGFNQQPYSYLIYADAAGNYYAKDGTNALISYNSTNADYVFSSACAQGGLIFVKKGMYNGTSLHLSNPSVRLIGEGERTILLFTKGITITNTSESYHLEISNLQLIGTGYQNSGLTLNGVSRIVSYNLIIQNYNIGVCIQSSPTGSTIFNNFYSLISHNNNIGVQVKRTPGDNTVAHNTFFGGSIVTNLQWGVVIEGLVSNEIFEGVEIENNCLGQVKLTTIKPGLVPEGNTFSKCYLEPWLEDPTTPFIEFTSELSPETKPWGNIFRENKFAVVGETTLTLPTNTIFTNNYISGAPVTFTIIATAPGCIVDGNINPTGSVNVNYVGTGNTGRIMQTSKVTLATSGTWIDFDSVFPSSPVVQVSVTGNGKVIDAWAYQIETSRFYLVMFYSDGAEVTTPQYVTWTATLNLP